jgi:MerR family copper efflux transcriptional regulator
MPAYNIGEASLRSGVSAKMIRHYEELGLTPKPRRTESGYRVYEESDVHTLRFIRRARDLGFSIRRIAELLGLWQNRRRRSAEVKVLALAHIRELEARIAETRAMKAALERFVHCCDGGERPHCPILDTLAGDEHDSPTAPSRCGDVLAAPATGPSRPRRTPSRKGRVQSAGDADRAT